MSGEEATDVVRCPTCGPTEVEPHPRHVGVTRCANCKEWLSGPTVRASADELTATIKAAYEMGRADERERITAALIEAAPPVNFGMSHDGHEDPLASAYVEGWHDAFVSVGGVG